MRPSGLRAIAATLLLAACGTDPTSPPDWRADSGIGGASSCSAPASLAVVTTDYTTGSVALVDLESLEPRLDLATVRPDAVLRCGCGFALVVERLGGDNLTVLDPETLRPVSQVPLGARSNPQDAWLDGTRAYVTLAETDEVVAVNLGSGTIGERTSLGSLADADGHAEPAAITGYEGRLFVAVQRLDRATPLFDPSGPSAIAVLERAPLTVVASIELEGENPVTQIRPEVIPGVALVGHAGRWEDPLDGGIERVDLAAQRTLGVAISGGELGGSVVDFVVLRADLGYALINVVSEADRLVSFDPTRGRRIATVAEAEPYSMVRLALDEEGRILVASRDPAAPGIRVFDAATGLEVRSRPVPTGLPPFDLCLVPRAAGGPGGDLDADVDADADTGPDPFADEVVSFDPAAPATFGANLMPDVVLGPPNGAGPAAGSTDVVSLGCGGSIILRFDEPVVDGPGPDLIVFENPFRAGEILFAEPGSVGVSSDGTAFEDFPCEPAVSLTGCAGATPVLSSPANGVSPTDPAVAGGDAFDLAAIGVRRATHVRVVDRSRERGASAAQCATNSAGFDLDAMAAIH